MSEAVKWIRIEGSRDSEIFNGDLQLRWECAIEGREGIFMGMIKPDNNLASPDRFSDLFDLIADSVKVSIAAVPGN